MTGISENMDEILPKTSEIFLGYSLFNLLTLLRNQLWAFFEGGFEGVFHENIALFTKKSIWIIANYPFMHHYYKIISNEAIVNEMLFTGNEWFCNFNESWNFVIKTFFNYRNFDIWEMKGVSLKFYNNIFLAGKFELRWLRQAEFWYICK